MSPEQASGDREIDGRADIYSLACVLFEALAAEPPFTARAAHMIIAAKLSGIAPRSVRDLRRDVPSPARTPRRESARPRTPETGSRAPAAFGAALAAIDPVIGRDLSRCTSLRDAAHSTRRITRRLSQRLDIPESRVVIEPHHARSDRGAPRPSTCSLV
jgi:serine/threonine protein kinase